MGGIKLSVHPLFFALGFYYALTGRIFVFLIYTVLAVIHELGHSFVASAEGYKLNKITLMPFGAVVKGCPNDVTAKEEIKIALAGPFINLAVGLFFVALWWIVPELYAITDVVVEASLSMAIINFLPVYPLDGGRVAFALMRTKLNRAVAEKISFIVGIVFSIALFALFIVSIFFTANFSLLFFALFAFFGIVGREKQNVYVRLFSGTAEGKLARGLEVKKIAVDKSITVKRLMKLLDVERLNEVDVYFNGEKITTLSQANIKNIVEKCEINQPIGKFIAK